MREAASKASKDAAAKLMARKLGMRIPTHYQVDREVTEIYWHASRSTANTSTISDILSTSTGDASRSRPHR